MGKRFIGATVFAATLVLAGNAQQFLLLGQQRAPQPVPAQAPAPQRGQATPTARAARIGGHPNLNGIWQAMGSAYWNLEAHNAEQLEEFWKLGAIGAIPAGKSVIRGGTIPYLPDALKKRNENRKGWPATDPEAKCYMLGIPRATYHNMPFQIFQGAGDADLLMVYPFEAMHRVIYTKDKRELPIDSWMGKSMGAWEGDTLVVTTINQNDQTWLDRAGNHHSPKLKVTERFALTDSSHIRYEATMDDPLTYSRPWTIEMTLYRDTDPNTQLLEHKCVPFADMLLYQDLFKPKQ